jgi:transposase-like protein
VTRPNQLWATDITYIPMARGFVYLVAIIDWFSRRVLAWRVSITLDADFCIEALEEALARFGKPDIFNTDQGSQFTSIAFTGVLERGKIAISIDVRGCWRDNVLLSAFGARSNTRRSTSTPTVRSQRRERGSAATSTSTTAFGRTRALAAGRPTRYTSSRRFSQRHDDRPAIHLSDPRGCSDKPSHLYQ